MDASASLLILAALVGANADPETTDLENPTTVTAAIAGSVAGIVLTVGARSNAQSRGYEMRPEALADGGSP